MGKCQRVLRCYHCGSVLQTKDPKQKGYISVESVGGDLTTNRILYCDRCFDVIRSFNNSALDLQIDQDILRILDDAIATDATIAKYRLSISFLTSSDKSLTAQRSSSC